MIIEDRKDLPLGNPTEDIMIKTTTTEDLVELNIQFQTPENMIGLIRQPKNTLVEQTGLKLKLDLPRALQLTKNKQMSQIF